MLTHEVVKAFDADRRLKSGEKVDASGWRNTELLVKQGMLRPLSASGTTRAASEGGDNSVLLGEVLSKLRSIEGRLTRLEAGEVEDGQTPAPLVPPAGEQVYTEEPPSRAPGKAARKKKKGRARTARTRSAAPAAPAPPVTGEAEKE